MQSELKVTSYNLVYGRPNTASPYLNSIVRQWTSQPLLIVSDAFGPSNIVNLQHYYATQPEGHAVASVSGAAGVRAVYLVFRGSMNIRSFSFQASGGATGTPARTPTVGSAGNLAQGRPASADSAQTANAAASGNDGNTGTRWSANNGNTGHWWQVDLGSARSLTGSEVMWEFGGRAYQYRVEVSSDGAAWTAVVNKTSNTSTAQTQRDTFSATARFVRITMTGLQASPVT